MKYQKKHTFLIKLKSVILNSLLLMIPSFIFIVVKVNPENQTIIWRIENILIFFMLYMAILSMFIFKPHMYIIRTPFVKKYTTITSHGVTNIMQQRWTQLVLVGLFVALPWVINLYHIKILIYVFVFLIFALGLNYTVGYAGILNLGHVLPFATGAYAYGIIYKFFALGFFPGLIVGALLGMIVGWLISLITLRLNGDYLAIVTLALAEIFKLIVNNFDKLTGGARGIPAIPLPNLVGISLAFKQRYMLLYYIAGALALVGILLATRLVKSRFGRSWEAMREDPIAAESMGINIKKVRMTVFAIGGFYAGVAGVLDASRSTYVSPSSVALLYSITVLSIVVLGGMGSIRGVLLGTLMVILLPEYLRTFDLYRMLIYGIVLVIMMRYRQKGLLPQQRIIYPKPKLHHNSHTHKEANHA